MSKMLERDVITIWDDPKAKVSTVRGDITNKVWSERECARLNLINPELEAKVVKNASGQIAVEVKMISPPKVKKQESSYATANKVERWDGNGKKGKKS
jgi:hypothetical protein